MLVLPDLFIGILPLRLMHYTTLYKQCNSNDAVKDEGPSNDRNLARNIPALVGFQSVFSEFDHWVK